MRQARGPGKGVCVGGCSCPAKRRGSQETRPIQRTLVLGGKELGLVALTIAGSRGFAHSRLPSPEGRHVWGGAAPGGQWGAGGGGTELRSRPRKRERPAGSQGVAGAGSRSQVPGHGDPHPEQHWVRSWDLRVGELMERWGYSHPVLLHGSQPKAFCPLHLH